MKVAALIISIVSLIISTVAFVKTIKKSKVITFYLGNCFTFCNEEMQY